MRQTPGVLHHPHIVFAVFIFSTATLLVMMVPQYQRKVRHSEVTFQGERRSNGNRMRARHALLYPRPAYNLRSIGANSDVVVNGADAVGDQTRVYSLVSCSKWVEYQFSDPASLFLCCPDPDDGVPAFIVPPLTHLLPVSSPGHLC